MLTVCKEILRKKADSADSAEKIDGQKTEIGGLAGSLKSDWCLLFGKGTRVARGSCIIMVWWIGSCVWWYADRYRSRGQTFPHVFKLGNVQRGLCYVHSHHWAAIPHLCRAVRRSWLGNLKIMQLTTHNSQQPITWYTRRNFLYVHEFCIRVMPLSQTRLEFRINLLPNEDPLEHCVKQEAIIGHFS